MGFDPTLAVTERNVIGEHAMSHRQRTPNSASRRYGIFALDESVAGADSSATDEAFRHGIHSYELERCTWERHDVQ
jgi:hypothetical protein